MSDNAYDDGVHDALAGNEKDEPDNPVYMAGYESVASQGQGDPEDVDPEPSDARADFEQTSADKVQDEDERPEFAWERVKGKPLLAHFAAIDRLAEVHERLHEFTLKAQESVDEALAAKAGFTITVSADESLALSLGLQLVGFFSPPLAEVAKDLAWRAKNEQTKLSDEEWEAWHEALSAARDQVFLEALAAEMGLTPEEFLGKQEAQAGDEPEQVIEAGVRNPSAGLN